MPASSARASLSSRSSSAETISPFAVWIGGRGLSGTGPKAGGPITLYRFAEERVLSVNTTAAGGNAALLALDDE